MKNKQLVSRIGMTLVATALVGASAFADSRPSNETRVRRGEGGRIQRGSSDARTRTERGDNSSNASRERRGDVERRSQRRESDRTDARVEVRGERDRRSENRDRSYRNDDRSNRDNDRSYRNEVAAVRADVLDIADTNVVSPTASAQINNDRSYRNKDRSSRNNDRSYRNNDRSNRSNDRSYRNNDRSYRNNDRYRDNDRSDRSRSWGRSNDHYRQPYWSHGRVSRVHRYGDGYRIWIVGTPYPFYIPLAYYRHDRFRVGVSINLGGYYNSLGYYDYYDGRSDGAIRGVVESVDYRRDSFVIRNDATGSFVTVLSRDRRLDVRAGDYVELAGEWTRSGVFTAWDVDFLENRSNDYDYRR